MSNKKKNINEKNGVIEGNMTDPIYYGKVLEFYRKESYKWWEGIYNKNYNHENRNNTSKGRS